MTNYSSLPSHSESDSDILSPIPKRTSSLPKNYLTNIAEVDEDLEEGDHLLLSRPYSDRPSADNEDNDEEELHDYLSQRRDRFYEDKRARRRRRCRACHRCCLTTVVVPGLLVLLYLWVFLPVWPFGYFVRGGAGIAKMNVIEGEFPDTEESVLGSEVPDYVLKYGMSRLREPASENRTNPAMITAPVVYLHEQEDYLPSDLAAHLSNTVPRFSNWSRVTETPSPLTLDNLADLNAYENGNIYLSTKYGIQHDQDWYHGVEPDPETGATIGARSTTIVLVDKGDGVVDAFYLYFYAYNQGSGLWGMRFGDHVGDWEQNMIRFKDGIPYAVWYSQHSNGEAFLYDALEKEEDDNGNDLRPIAYSALGTHANYATPGRHDHTLPNRRLPYGIINDYTSRGGSRWDPTLSFYAYKYNPNLPPSDIKAYTPLPSIPEEIQTNDEGNASVILPPTNWITFQGKWGDNKYPKDAKGQYDFFGEKRYIPGPGGPGVPRKNLGRRSMCRDENLRCVVKDRRT